MNRSVSPGAAGALAVVLLAPLVGASPGTRAVPAPGSALARGASPQAVLRRRRVQPEPGDVMRSARTVFVRSGSVFVSAGEVRDQIERYEEFGEWGLSFADTRDAADLVLEVHRVPFTVEFPFKIVDARGEILASGKVSSLGGTVPSKLASQFVRLMRLARPVP